MYVSARRSRKVVLYLPAYGGKVFGAPLSLLSLAGAVHDAGFDPIVIDGALDGDALRTIDREVRDALCFGISVLTGPSIRSAIAAAEYVKRIAPDVPVIFGGWHPSLLPAETLREPFVDIVVKHQGERTLVEIARRLASGSSLDFIEGCWFKRGGRIEGAPDRHTMPLEQLPAPAYDLANVDAYAALVGERMLPYATSIGCPYACNYCTDQVFYNRRFNAYSAARAAEEMTGLAERFRLTRIALVDSNFLVDTHRAAAIAEELARRSTRFAWSFQASTDLLCRMPDEEVELLRRAGVSHIGFGTESASESVLHLMNKRHQHIPDLYEAARKCQRAGIPVTYNLILGYPGETAADRRETWRIMGDIASRYPNVQFSPNVFTPYPGIPIWPQLRQLGLREPQTLAEWANVDLGATSLPWLRGRALGQLNRSIEYFVLSSEVSKASGKPQKPAMLRQALAWARKPLQWRLRRDWFALPVELWAVRARRWLITRRSLLTGQPLSRSPIYGAPAGSRSSMPRFRNSSKARSVMSLIMRGS